MCIPSIIHVFTGNRLTNSNFWQYLDKYVHTHSYELLQSLYNVTLRFMSCQVTKHESRLIGPNMTMLVKCIKSHVMLPSCNN